MNPARLTVIEHAAKEAAREQSEGAGWRIWKEHADLPAPSDVIWLIGEARRAKKDAALLRDALEAVNAWVVASTEAGHAPPPVTLAAESVIRFALNKTRPRVMPSDVSLAEYLATAENQA